MTDVKWSYISWMLLYKTGHNHLGFATISPPRTGKRPKPYINWQTTNLFITILTVKAMRENDTCYIIIHQAPNKKNYLNNFSDAILAALIIWWLGTDIMTRFGSARMGEWILISLTKEAEIIRHLPKKKNQQQQEDDYTHTTNSMQNKHPSSLWFIQLVGGGSSHYCII